MHSLLKKSKFLLLLGARHFFLLFADNTIVVNISFYFVKVSVIVSVVIVIAFAATW